MARAAREHAVSAMLMMFAAHPHAAVADSRHEFAAASSAPLRQPPPYDAQPPATAPRHWPPGRRHCAGAADVSQVLPYQRMPDMLRYYRRALNMSHAARDTRHQRLIPAH